MVLPYAKKISNSAFRAGYVKENSNIAFKGNILYFEGLSDSIRNHAPLFSRLSEEGYRVIAFDYMGQGGSDGSMNDTRIADIAKMGDLAWNAYAHDLKNFPTKTILGWSTGGLAAYEEAFRGHADRVVLIAPGIIPKAVALITEDSLTTARYDDTHADPHLDPLSVHSPMEVLNFSNDLMDTGADARGAPEGKLEYFNPFASAPEPYNTAKGWKIPGSVKGFVLLSDPKDKYVWSAETAEIIQMESNFETKQYAGALHEIDNEKDEIRFEAYQDIVDFLRNTDSK
jgi:alpha-beta hydrolase superfamily lysophospholipase